MQDGWIKVHRTILQSKQFAHGERFRVWVWMLCKASINRRFLTIKSGRITTSITLERGQFIFGRNSAEFELNIDSSTIYRYVHEMVANGDISIKSNNLYSVITVTNYHEYQQDEREDDFEIIEERTPLEQPESNQGTTSEHQADSPRTHNKKVKKVNKVKNVKNNNAVLFSESRFTDFDLFKMEFFGIQKYECLNLEEYHESAANWSASGGNKKVDWIATVKNWMNRDLKNKNYNNGTNQDRPIIAQGINRKSAGAHDYINQLRTLHENGNGHPEG